MADSQMKSTVLLIMLLNFCMYVVVLGIASWSMNRAVDHGFVIGPNLSLPAHFSPIYFPMGNAATGFFVTFSLIAGVVGVASIISGFVDFNSAAGGGHSMASTVSAGGGHSMASTVSAGAIAWSLTVLAMGFACKEIQKENRNAKLRTMEAFVIILSVTQLLYVLAVHSMSSKRR